jgi:hypothetical protein
LILGFFGGAVEVEAEEEGQGVFGFGHPIGGTGGGIEGGVAGGEIADEHAVREVVERGVEVVNPELVEVAEGDVRRAVGDEVEPVIEGLLVVFGEFGAADKPQVGCAAAARRNFNSSIRAPAGYRKGERL